MNYLDIKNKLANACGEASFSNANARLQTDIVNVISEAIAHVNQIAHSDEQGRLLSFNTTEPVSVSVTASEGDSTFTISDATVSEAWVNQIINVDDYYWEIINVSVAASTIEVNGAAPKSFSSSAGKVYFFRYWPTMFDIRSVLSARYNNSDISTMSTINILSYINHTGSPCMIAPSYKKSSGKRGIAVWPLPDDVYKVDAIITEAIADIDSDTDEFYPEEAVYAVVEYAKVLLYELGYRSAQFLVIATEAFKRKIRAYAISQSKLRATLPRAEIGMSDEDLIAKYGNGGYVKYESES